MAKIRHKHIIYDIFQYNSEGKNETLNDILKGTKSVLASKNGFQEYIHNYSLSTKKPSFKMPGISEYPLLKTESNFLVPVKIEKVYKKRNKTQEFMKKYKISTRKKLLLPNNLTHDNNNSSFLEKFNKRFNQFLRFKTDSNKIQKTKEIKVKRYNSLFLDFFNKWNENSNDISNEALIILKKNLINNKLYKSFDNFNNSESKKSNLDINISSINFNMKDRYNGLHYDENEIFNTNYDKFILTKINEIRENKIKNYLNEIESSFEDLNKKEIQLKLKSIKLIFYPEPISNTNKNFYIYLPLSYVFLFYYHDFNFFLKIIMSLLYFKKNFKEITFKDDELYNLLKEIKIKDVEIKDNTEIEKNNKDIDYLSKFRKSKKSIDQNTFLKGNKSNMTEKDLRKTFNKNNNLFMNKLFSNKKENKKIKIIHSNIKLTYRNKNLNQNEENKYKDNSNLNNKENINNVKNDDFYNEYYFMWETPENSYKVKMEMPKIYFLYEDIEYKIVTYCEKNLFLYLYKNNFVNWDFYVLNYIFTIKSFRAIILKCLSLDRDLILCRNIRHIKNLKTSSFKKLDNSYKLVEDDEDIENKKRNKNIILENKKIYNQMSESNEFYIFFYTDLLFNNYIIHFYSYKLIIEYKKLNPNLNWEFFLNFKQMRNLIEVSKYEKLITFLPKIIRTNFEKGLLGLNFNVFDENFNPKILQANHINSYNYKNASEMNLEINKPYIEIEKIFNDSEKVITKELEHKFLERINKIKMDDWSKILLEMVDTDLKSNRETTDKMEYLKSKFFKINGNEDNKSKKFKFIRNSKQSLTYAFKKRFKTDEIKFESIRKKKSNEA